MKNKKILYIAIAAIAVVLVAVLAIVFAGGNNNNGNNELAYSNTAEVIDIIWTQFPDYDDNGTEEEWDDFMKFSPEEDGEKMAYYNGGWNVDADYNLIQTENAAGSVMLDADQLDMHLGYPVDLFEYVVEASSLTAMNQNIFTCGAIRLAEGADITQIANAMEENIQNRMWMCGFPESVVIIELPGNYIVSFFGQSLVPQFVEKILATYEGAKVLIDNPIR